MPQMYQAIFDIMYKQKRLEKEGSKVFFGVICLVIVANGNDTKGVTLFVNDCPALWTFQGFYPYVGVSRYPNLILGQLQ